MIPRGVIDAVKMVNDIKNIIDPKEYEYASTQLDLPTGFANKVLSYGLEIPDALLNVKEDDDTMGREDKPHITVLYGIDTKKVTDVEKAVGKQPPITVELGKVSFFENSEKGYDVLKVDVKSEELDKLNKKLRKLLKASGNTFDVYKPHITIAYLKKGKAKKYQGDERFIGTKIIFSELDFSCDGHHEYIPFDI